MVHNNHSFLCFFEPSLFKLNLISHSALRSASFPSILSLFSTPVSSSTTLLNFLLSLSLVLVELSSSSSLRCKTPTKSNKFLAPSDSLIFFLKNLEGTSWPKGHLNL